MLESALMTLAGPFDVPGVVGERDDATCTVVERADRYARSDQRGRGR